jgi:hypothetical protein
MQNGIGESTIPSVPVQGISPLTEFIPAEDSSKQVMDEEIPPPDLHIDEGWDEEEPIIVANEEETLPEIAEDCLRIRFIKDVEQPVMDFDGNEVQPLVGDIFVFPEVLAKAMIKMGYAETASI